VNKTLFKNLIVRNITIENKEKSKLSVHINFVDNNIDLSKYKMAFHVYPKVSDMDLRQDRMKLRSINYDIGTYHGTEESNSIEFEVDTRIKNIKKIEIFLYDKSGYDGVIGDKVILDSISFSKK